MELDHIVDPLLSMGLPVVLQFGNKKNLGVLKELMYQSFQYNISTQCMDDRRNIRRVAFAS